MRRTASFPPMPRRLAALVAAVLVLAVVVAGAAATAPPLGATRGSRGGVTFRVRSARATRLEVYLYDRPRDADERLARVLTRGANDVWSTTVSASQLAAAGLRGTIYYGYRAWGPNWPFTPSWRKGSDDGFVADVDPGGNRFDPNKLLLDPYAREVSHDPIGDFTVFASGAGNRDRDSAPAAPKGIVLSGVRPAFGRKPVRPLKDEVVYEVHVRGLTMRDPSVPPALRGTYAGAARKAGYLHDLGITAVELLPVQETQNDQNDLTPDASGDNYWGYMTLGFFAPDRRYAADRSPGGPTREFQAMVRAFHDRGIKVYLDVVYNHTGEGALWGGQPEVANVLSWRGLDNVAYYELAPDPRFYWDNTGIGANFNLADPAVRDLVLDSLRWWSATLGVDGFRFDLASVLGNGCRAGCYRFDKLDPDNVLNRAVRELPVRPAAGGGGVDLIAEPWAIGDGTYQVGGFPAGWAEWNGAYRDVVRRAQNHLGVDAVTPGQLATRFAGSSDLYEDDGRRPWHSIDFLVAHDGLTLHDLYACNGKNNGQPWPFGPSDGGTDDNISWDQGGDPAATRQAARTGLALLLVSAGVPMITGGDEALRTLRCNNNPYNLDSEASWLDWDAVAANERFVTFAQRAIAFRRAHPALRPAGFFRGTDRNGNGRKDITWYRDDGQEADGSYMNDPGRHFLAWRLDGTEAGDRAAAIYVAYNGWSGPVTATLPAPAPGRHWRRVLDTAAWMEPQANAQAPGEEAVLDGPTYGLHERSVVVLIER